MTDRPGSVVVTGAAGYVGSLLCSRLLDQGRSVVGIDNLLYGGDSILPCLLRPGFQFRKADVIEPEKWQDLLQGAEAVVHLAAIVGFPACQSVGRTVAWRYNVEGVRKVYLAAREAGVRRFLFTSSYSTYGLTPSGAADEEALLNPQSIYSETKIAAEQFLQDRSDPSRCAPVILRLTSLFGVSPRTRFDLLINQFVQEALARRRLVIYQRGYRRSFIHVQDVVRGLMAVLDAPGEAVDGEVFNLGGSAGNLSKDEVARMIHQQIPETVVEYKDLTFGGDLHDIAVSFEKIRRVLGFEPRISIPEGIEELRRTIQDGLTRDPSAWHHRNAHFIVQ